MRKEFVGEVLKSNDVERVIEHTISSLTVDREGEVLIPKGVKYDNFLKNPVVLFAHNYKSPPIGKCLELRVEDDRIIAKTEFAKTSLGEELYYLVKEGFLKGWSVGFIPIKETDKKVLEGQRGKTYEEWELVEYSLVPVPSNPEALTLAVQKGLKVEEVKSIMEEIEKKGVIPYKQTPKAPEDTTWDGPKEIKEADVEDLKIMCAWYDSNNPDVKSSYKLPHHRAKDHYTVLRGVMAAMGALLGARGGVNIPDKDKKGVYNHLSKHYKEFDREPPEFKEYGPFDLLKLHLDGAIYIREVDDFIKRVVKERSEEIIEKEGRVLSEKNRKLVKEVVDAMDELREKLMELYNASEPAPKDSSSIEEKSMEEVLEDLRNFLKEVS